MLGMICKFRLVNLGKIDVYGFNIVEGKFLDLEEHENGNEVYVYTCLDDRTGDFNNSDIYVYAHPFDSVYDISNYELTANFDEETLEYMKQEILKNI